MIEAIGELLELLTPEVREAITGKRELDETMAAAHTAARKHGVREGGAGKWTAKYDEAKKRG